MVTPRAQGGRGMHEADREEPSLGRGGCNWLHKEEGDIKNSVGVKGKDSKQGPSQVWAWSQQPLGCVEWNYLVSLVERPEMTRNS